MKNKKVLFLFFLLVSLSGISQTFSGVVLDLKTKTPIESVSIYFDNTTIGTTTNSEGKFSISFSNVIQSGLVISYLGYETQTILDYRQKNNITIYLVSVNNVLDEVIVNADDAFDKYVNKNNAIKNTFDIANASIFYQKEYTPWGFEINATNIFDVTFKQQNSFNSFLISDSKTYILPRIIMFKVSYKV